MEKYMTGSLTAESQLSDITLLNHLHHRFLVRYWVTLPPEGSYEMVFVTILVGRANRNGETEMLFDLSGSFSIANAFSPLNASITWAQTSQSSRDRLYERLRKWERPVNDYPNMGAMFLKSDQCVAILHDTKSGKVRESAADSGIVMPYHFTVAQHIATNARSAEQHQNFVPEYNRMLRLLERRFSAFAATMRHSYSAKNPTE